MKTVASAVGQMVILLAVGLIVGLGANAVRGRDHIDLNRNYKPKIVVPPITTQPGAARMEGKNGLPGNGRGDASEAGIHPPPGSQPAGPTPEQPFQIISVKEAFEVFQDPKTEMGLYVFVDARADNLYRAGHIPKAVQCDYYRIGEYIDTVLAKVTGAEKVIVYCHGRNCEDSLAVCGELLNHALPWGCIYLLKGGWEEWYASGMPFQTRARE